MEQIRPQYHPCCFDKKFAAKHGYGAFWPTVCLILGIAGLGCAAWFVDPYATLGAVLCAAGLVLLLLSLLLYARRRAAQLTAFALGGDGRLYRAKRSGNRSVGLFAAGSAAGSLADTFLGTTGGSDLGELIGGIAGLAALSRLKKAMATPAVIEAMFEDPSSVRGARLIRIDRVERIKEKSNRRMLFCTGVDVKSGRAFTNKRIRVSKAYTEPALLDGAIAHLAE